MAGWDAHLQAKLHPLVKCKGALFGHDGVQWAGHASLACSADELKYLISNLNKEKPDDLYASGPKISGAKYMVTRFETKNLIIAKKGPDNAIIILNPQTVIICVVTEPDVTAAQGLIAAQSFAAYMKSMNY